jgi:hypothetical protein
VKITRQTSLELILSRNWITDFLSTCSEKDKCTINIQFWKINIFFFANLSTKLHDILILISLSLHAWSMHLLVWTLSIHTSNYPSLLFYLLFLCGNPARSFFPIIQLLSTSLPVFRARVRPQFLPSHCSWYIVGAHIVFYISILCSWNVFVCSVPLKGPTTLTA